MGDWKAVAKTAKKISRSTDRVDILINDAARGERYYDLSAHGIWLSVT